MRKLRLQVEWAPVTQSPGLSPGCSDPFTIPCHPSPSKSPGRGLQQILSPEWTDPLPGPPRSTLEAFSHEKTAQGSCQCLGRSPGKTSQELAGGGVMMRAQQNCLLEAGHPGVRQALPSSPCRWQAEINSSRTTLPGPKGECP